MALDKLEGYADTSGHEDTVTEKIITVNGCLSTPTKWAEFENEWQDYLKGKGFKPDKTTGKYVFHTAPFWSQKGYELMPQNLDEAGKQEIYNHLIGIICKHTVFRFGYGVVLDDFRRIESEFPHIRETWLKKPGTRMSFLCFRLNSLWAESNKYNPSISYRFDRGDRFYGELYSEWRRTTKDVILDDRTAANLSDGNKAQYIPIQAADVIAWECRQYFYERLNNGEVDQTGFEILPRPELRRMNVFGKSSLRLYTQQHLKEELLDAVNDAISDESREWLIGEGKPFQSIEDYARAVFQFDKEETKAKQTETRLKRGRKNIKA